VTIQKSIKRFRELETMRSTGQYDLFSKKEIARYERERKKLEKNLSGIKEMGTLPDALFIIDTKLEAIAIQEAAKLGIPIIGVADTNCDPDEIDYIIPGNDDALRAIRLITDTIAQAYLDGKEVYEAHRKEQAAQMEKQRQVQAEARRNAEDKDFGESAPAESAGGADAGQRPRTTMRRTLQRKAKAPRKQSEQLPSTEPAAAQNDASEPAGITEPEQQQD
jgi:hypothetical protein